METRFKVGDRVRIRSEYTRNNQSRSGVIQEGWSVTFNDYVVLVDGRVEFHGVHAVELDENGLDVMLKVSFGED